MEAVCGRGEARCEARALTAALHALHVYCAALAAALITCCAARPPWHAHDVRWRGQNTRGVASLVGFVAWCCGAAGALLRTAERAALAGALLAPPAAAAAAWLHVALAARRAAAPLLYLALYWLLAAAAAADALLYHFRHEGAHLQNFDLYIQAVTLVTSLVMAVVDCICFYDGVAKRLFNTNKVTSEPESNIGYRHDDVHFYSKVTFFWLNSLLYRGYKTPLEEEDLGDLPEHENASIHYNKFNKIYAEKLAAKGYEGKVPSLWSCYTRMVWPNFYIAGVLKLLSDLVGVMPPLGLAVIIQFIDGPAEQADGTHPLTVHEFLANGYTILVLMTLALVAQALLSQNSTHLVTVEGTRLKTALQALIYDKCIRLAPWNGSSSEVDEESPLLPRGEAEPTQSGLLTNLISQDTYNIMSCVWICHYTWAIPIKVSLILYLLYTKLGASAIVGTIITVLFITPMQFYIGKKISDNSKEIAKCTDHRITKMTEILQGINVIKLYVWEDLFKEKILNLRELELKLLNKDTVYWNILTFSTQVSTILLTVTTFTVYYFINSDTGLNTVNVFAGLALFNQLTVPLLILPVTALMIIQARVSTQRIEEFLALPESNNIAEEDETLPVPKTNSDKFNDAFVDQKPEDKTIVDENQEERPTDDGENDENSADSDEFSDDENPAPRPEHVVQFRNAVFSWGVPNDTSVLEIDNLDIPSGKLIMVVGTTGSGKSSLLSAVLGEMFLERGNASWHCRRSAWYAGQPPWLLEGSVRDNIVMEGSWCQRRYARVLRSTGLRPDLQLMPEGDATRLGHRGAPLSGGQRVRVCVARALYSRARLVVLDEPLAALDALLARHLVARALVPAARAGRTVLLATNRLELMHYADLVVVMEDGRVGGFGRMGAGVVGAGGAVSGAGEDALARWARLAAEARATTARCGAGPPGGAARERSRLVRALTRAKFHRTAVDDATVGISEVTGAHLLAEVPSCGRGSHRRRPRPALARQLSTPPAAQHKYLQLRNDIRRVVSADASNSTLQREASLIRRLLRPRPHRTLARWTPRPLRRLLSSDSEPNAEDPQANGAPEESGLETTYTSMTSNGGVETATTVSSSSSDKDHTPEDQIHQSSAWRWYWAQCGGWRWAHAACAAAAQALALAADYWLANYADRDQQNGQYTWECVRWYAAWVCCGAAVGGAAAAAGGAAAAAARRALHERLLHATLHAPLHAAQLGPALQRFAVDVNVVDRKLGTAVSRWAALGLACGAAAVVSAATAPIALLPLAPALAAYYLLQNLYLTNARELQRAEAVLSAPVLSACSEAVAGGRSVRVARLQRRLRARLLVALSRAHHALLLLNAANRWLGLAMDLLGAAVVCATMCVGVWAGRSGSATGGGAAGLAGAHALLLPAYLAHLAKSRADLDLHLAAVHRLRTDIEAPQEDYREDCPIPTGWKREGKIELENVTVQHEPGAPPALVDVTLTLQAGEQVAICGRSGSGKSTLLLACVGGVRLCAGRILLDGVDVSRVPLRALRHRLVVLPQEPALFAGTLRENLDPLAVHTDHEIWQSLRVVGLHDFVAAQPAGLECMVSGCGWSGGRLARLAAARAAVRAPHCAALLLDEPCAALDAAAARRQPAALHQHAPHATLAATAHRISSIRSYSRAVVVERGRVVEQGAPATLLSRPASRLARLLVADQPHDNTAH